MTSYIILNYSDIYPGPKPVIEELLKGINSKIVIAIMSIINAELRYEEDHMANQNRITNFVSKGFLPNDRAFLYRGFVKFSELGKGPIVLWARRYVLEFMKYEMLHYREGESEKSTPQEELRILKAYLLITEGLNERTRKELKEVTVSYDKADEFYFERMVWPFVLAQFESNNLVNPMAQFFKLLALIKHSSTDLEIASSWQKFIKLNGFKSLGEYLGSVHHLVEITLKIYPDKQWKVFSWVKGEDLPVHLLNLSFDRSAFNAEPEKQIDFKGFRERPLFQMDANTFVILDIDFLNNKVYNGPLFDLFYQTDMATHTRFKKFSDFKTNIGTHVSEHIIFKGMMKRLFAKKDVIIHFDEDNVDGYPDCYLRLGNKIFLIEFKDYLFPGKLVDTYSFDQIKAHIDEKFIKNQNGSKKGISQIIAQLQILATTKFEFDEFITQRPITVYPIIVHTNFTYQMPGVNHYLNTEFKKRLSTSVPELANNTADLLLIDNEIFFDFLHLRGVDLPVFESFLKRYYHILKNREKRFVCQVNQDNFVRARAGFEEVVKTVIVPECKETERGNRIQVLMDTIGIDEFIVESFEIRDGEAKL